MPVLTLLILIPLVALLGIGLWPGQYVRAFRIWALGAGLLQLLWFLVAIVPQHRAFEPIGDPNINPLFRFSLLDYANWMRIDLGNQGQLDIDFILGMDGVNIILVGLTILLLLVTVLNSWHTEKRPKAYFVLILLVNLCTLGTLTALDSFLFLLFFGLMLLPLYLLTAGWGNEKSRLTANRLLVRSMVGFVILMLVLVAMGQSFIDPEETGERITLIAPESFRYTALQVQEMLFKKDPGFKGEWKVWSFSFTDMIWVDGTGKHLANGVPGTLFAQRGQFMGMTARHLGFFLVTLAFLTRMPVVPFHTWLPDLHEQARPPVAGLITATGFLLAGYSILRLGYGLFPEGGAVGSKYLALLGVITLLYSSVVAWAQKNLKRLIAYFLASQSGLLLLGLASMTAMGTNGSLLHIFSLVLTLLALMLLTQGLEERTGDLQPGSYSGLWSKVPRFSFMMLVFFFAAIGLPGFSGFISELMIFMGAMDSGHSASQLSRLLPVLATLGILLAAGYFMWTFKRMFFGEYRAPQPQSSDLPNLGKRELMICWILALALLITGLFPSLLLRLMDTSVAGWVDQMNGLIP